MSPPSGCVKSDFPYSPSPPPSVSGCPTGPSPPGRAAAGHVSLPPRSEEHRGQKNWKMQHKTHPRRFRDLCPKADTGSEDWNLLRYPGHRASWLQRLYNAVVTRPTDICWAA